jgi:hypothetical protein
MVWTVTVQMSWAAVCAHMMLAFCGWRLRGGLCEVGECGRREGTVVADGGGYAVLAEWFVHAWYGRSGVWRFRSISGTGGMRKLSAA